MHLLLQQFIAFAERESLLARSFLVGGAVRDLLMAKVLQDIDVAIQDDSLAVGRRFADDVRGSFVLLDADFGIVRVVQGKHSLDLCAVRGDSIHEDLAGRDLTINAMAVPLTDLRQPGSETCWSPAGLDGRVHLIDPHQGLRDLRHGMIRMVSEENLARDPLRLLRIYRFAATLGFDIDIVTAAAVRTHASRIRTVAAERTLEELRHLLSVTFSYRTIREMEREGLLFHLFPEMAGASDNEKRIAFRTYHYAEHILNNLSLYFPGEAAPLKAYFEHEYRAPYLKLAALLPGDGAVAAAGRLKMSRSEARYMLTIVANRDRVVALGKGESKSSIRLFKDLEDSLYALLVLTIAAHFVCQCADHPVLSLSRQVLSSYHREFLTRKRLLPLITGDDLIGVFHLTPSPIFRELLSRVDELVLQGDITTREGALEAVRGWLSRRG